MSFHDLALAWNDDLVVSAQGDLLTKTNIDLLKERLIRRILTFRKAVIFHPEFGAGIPEFVHAAVSGSVYDEIKHRIIDQVFAEEVVVRDPFPQIDFITTYNGVWVKIVVYTVDSNVISLGFEVTRNGNFIP